MSIIIFLHGLSRLTCSGIDALPSFPGASADCLHLVGVGGRRLEGLSNLTGYAGGNFMFLVGSPKPDRP